MVSLPWSNDDFVTCGNGDDFISTGDGDDTIFADIGPFDSIGGDDTVYAGDDDDLVRAFGGDNVIYGGDGDDTLITADGDDYIDAGEGDDEDVQSGRGADTVYGSGGNDTLRGGEGNDYVNGGPGNDRVIGSSDDDTVVGGKGNDMVEGRDGDDSLDGGPGRDTLEGGPDDDRLDGGDDNDILAGQPGDDLLVAGPGNDLYDGGVGDDTLSFASGLGGVSVDLGAETASGPETGSDTVRSIEHVIGGGGDDVLTGDGGANRLEGGAGADTLQGAAGDDTLAGGDGDDKLDGGEDNDILAGQPGDDLLVAGPGNDLYDGGVGDDTLSFASGLGGVSVDLGAETASGPETGSDTVRSIEHVIGGGGNDVLTGDGGANRLEGGAGADTLRGADGDDTLAGGDGEDQLDGGDGDDTLIGGGGDDMLYGDSGPDCVRVRFISEDAGYQSTYGWYDTDTLEARILVANVDTATNPGLEGFVAGLPLTPVQSAHLGFFLIPNGYGWNSDPGEPFAAGTDPMALDLEVFGDGGAWKIREAGSGYVFEGAGAPAYFTEADKNPDGLDHAMEEGDLIADGAVTYSWEDLPNAGAGDFDDVVFQVDPARAVTVSFVGEDAGYRSSYGYYDTETGEAHLLVTNVDTVTNPDIEDLHCHPLPDRRRNRPSGVFHDSAWPCLERRYRGTGARMASMWWRRI